jgi:transcriptional regulator with XRE-family HTH domain
VVAWSSRGDIIRWWRTDVLGLSQQQVAGRLAVRPTALSNWELGARAISVDIEQIDKALEADGVLAGLLWGLRTPKGLEPQFVWAHTFAGPSMPVWAWLRSEVPRIRVEAEWGVFRVDTELDVGPNGVFLTVGGSVSESPVVIRSLSPCWIDYGRGEMPTEVPGATVIAAFDIATASSARGLFMDLFKAQMESRFSGSHHREVANLERAAPHRVGAFFERYNSSRQPVPAPWPPLSPGAADIERQRFAALRQARELSLAETADRLAATTDVRVSRDTLRRFENNTGAPHDRLLPVALDHVLGGQGYLAPSEIRAGRGHGMVRFPPYWQAPVWFSFTGPPDAPPPELHWGAWKRRLTGGLPLLVISHYAEAVHPLRIVADDRISWTAGVGYRYGAVPINHDWVPISVDATNKALSETREAVVDAMRACSELEDQGQRRHPGRIPTSETSNGHRR